MKEFLVSYTTRQKALHKAVHAIENKADLQCNKIFHLEDSMVMYGVYNSDTLEDFDRHSPKITQ